MTRANGAIIMPTRKKKAEVAELADALDSKSSVPKGRVGSSPTFGMLRSKDLQQVEQLRLPFSPACDM